MFGMVASSLALQLLPENSQIVCVVACQGKAVMHEVRQAAAHCANFACLHESVTASHARSARESTGVQQPHFPCSLQHCKPSETDGMTMCGEVNQCFIQPETLLSHRTLLWTIAELNHPMLAKRSFRSRYVTQCYRWHGVRHSDIALRLT